MKMIELQQFATANGSEGTEGEELLNLKVTRK